MSEKTTYAAWAAIAAMAATFLAMLWNLDPVYVKAAWSSLIIAGAAFNGNRIRGLAE